MMLKAWSSALLFGMAFNVFGSPRVDSPPPLLGPENLVLQPEYDTSEPNSTGEKLQYMPPRETGLLTEKLTTETQESDSVFEESKELYVGAEADFKPTEEMILPEDEVTPATHAPGK